MSSRKNMFTSQKRLRILVLLICLFLASCSDPSSSKNSEEERTIHIAVIPTEDAQQQLLHLEPLRGYLSRTIGVPVEFQITTDYTAAIEALRANHVQMAWLGPFSYVLACDLVDITPVVGGIRKDTNNIYYESIILVRADSGIESLADLPGHTFAFVDPASTSGYLFPLAELLEAGINPERDFEAVVYAGSHTAVELAIANGQVDAAADSLPSYNLMVEEGAVDPEQVRIIWVSDPIPPSPVVARQDLGDDTIRRVREVLVTAGPEVISFEGEIAGYAPVSDSDYDVIREVAQRVGVMPNK
jgi:phosphonate transport system substrate-binding protein